jgi:type II secretory ATPase GspE/PulE/Tfp pilus assembly ATPase PilB-like protein
MERVPAPVLATPAGCPECGGSGYRGRVGLYELMEATPQLRSLIQARAPTERIRACAIADGMRTLRQEGIERVLEGVTTMEQVRAACP